MKEISEYQIEYMNNILIINIIDSKEIENDKFSIINVCVKREDSICYLGEFYIDYKEHFNEKDINDIEKTIFDNIDKIIFENNRYIGENDSVIDYLRSTTTDENLEEIYLEFINMDTSSKDYLKYSRFLELYFHSHKIPDSIKKIFLDKNSSSILDYDNLDNEIKKDFSSSLDELIIEKEQNKLIETKNGISLNIKQLEEELLFINDIIEMIETLIQRKERNHQIKVNIIDLENKLNSLNFFDKERKNIKLSIKELTNSIDQIDMAKERQKIKEIFENYASLYNDSRGLSILFDNLGLGEILFIIKDIYTNKIKIYEELKSKKTSLEEQIFDYETIDISDLYERLERTKVKE